MAIMHRPDESVSYAAHYSHVFNPPDTFYTPRKLQESPMDGTNPTQVLLGTIDPEIHLEPPSFKYEAWNSCFDGPQVECNSSLGVRDTQRFPLSEHAESKIPAPLNFMSEESTMAHPRPIPRHRRPDLEALGEREPVLPPNSAPGEQEPKSLNELVKSPKKVPLHIHPDTPNAIATQSTNTLISSPEGKPAKIPYAKLIYWALCGAKGHSMTLREIYKWFEEHTDKAKDPYDKGWQNSVRHNLSMNGDFLKKPHPDLRERTKNSFVWVLAPPALERGIESTTRYRCKRDDPYRVQKATQHHPSRRRRKLPNSKPGSPPLSATKSLPALRNGALTCDRSDTLRFSLPGDQVAAPAMSSDCHEHHGLPTHCQHYLANHTNPTPYPMIRHYEPGFANFTDFAGFECQNFLLARV